MNVRQKIKAAMSLSAATLALLHSDGNAKTKDIVLAKSPNTNCATNLASQVEKLILAPTADESDLKMMGRGGGHSSHSSHSSHYSGGSSYRSSHSSHSSHYSTTPSHYSGSSYYAPPAQPSYVQPSSTSYTTTVSPEEVERKAVEILKKLADSGDPSAQYALAIRYLAGKGVEKDTQKAISLLKAAAVAGNATAKAKLKDLLLEVDVNRGPSTNGVAITNVVIVTSLVSPEVAAAESEDAKLMYERAMKFLTGTDGERQDIERAKLYLKFAAEDGSKRATNVLKQLNEKLK